MFSKKHKKILLVTGSVASENLLLAKKSKEKISYIDLDMVVNLIYEQNTELKNKLLNVNSSFIKNNKINKNNVKNAISQNPKLLDFLELSIYPLLKNKLDLLIKHSNNLLIIIEVPLII